MGSFGKNARAFCSRGRPGRKRAGSIRGGLRIDVSGPAVKMAGWPRVIAHPGLPQIRTCTTRAYGSSSDGLAAYRHETLSRHAPCVGEATAKAMARCGSGFADRATRCSGVDTVWEFDVSTVFLSNGSITRRPLPSTGSPGGRVPLLPRYYQALRLPVAHPAALRFLRLAVPAIARGWRRPGLPRSWGTSIVPLPCSPTPADPYASGLGGGCDGLGRAYPLPSLSAEGASLARPCPLPPRYNATARPPLKPRRRLLHCDFRGSITRLRHSLSTPRSGGLLHLHARLASGCLARLCQTGLGTRKVPVKGFRVIDYVYMISFPFPKLRGARFVS